MASSSSSSSFYKITLRCSDGKEVEADSRLAANSATVRRLLERHVDDPIPLPNIESHVLPKVIEYCYMHADAEADADDQLLKAWDVEFMRTADEKDLLDLVVAASYLEVKGLLELVGNKLKALSDEAERQRRRRRRRGVVCAGFSAMLLVAVILIAGLCYVLFSST